MTVKALEDAFVRVLIDHGALDRVRVREVVELAGVGIGTFYDYFADLQALAVSAVDARRSALINTLRTTMALHAQAPLAVLVDVMLDDQVTTALANPKEWAALILMERQVADLQAFQLFHQGLKDIWVDALQLGGVHAELEQIQSLAAMVHAITYGWCIQEILVFRGVRSRAQSRQTLGQTVHSCLKAMLNLNP